MEETLGQLLARVLREQTVAEDAFEIARINLDQANKAVAEAFHERPALED
jgi:hypothetical protein